MERGHSPQTSRRSAARGRKSPGRVEHKQNLRRHDVANAALGVIARDGLDRASLRAIASELQCSTGILTHYFRDKTHLITFVLDELNKRVLKALEAHSVSDFENLQSFLLALLPTGQERNLNWSVWIAFTAASIAQPALKRQQKERDDMVLERLVKVIEAALPAHSRSSGLNIECEAELLLCIIDGLGLHAILDPKRFPPTRQVELLAHYLSRVAQQTSG